MECVNCGCVVEDGKELCPNCGELMDDAEVAEEVISPRNSALSVLKSPIYMLAGIAWMVCLVFCLINFWNSLSDTNAGMILTSWLIDADILDDGKVVAVILFAVTVIPVFLNAIGFMTSAINARKGESGGLGVIKASSVISMIISLLLLVVLVISCVYIAIQLLGADSEDTALEQVNGTFWVTMMLIAVMVVFTIVFFSKMTTAFATVQDAVNQDKVYYKTPIYPAVMSCFWAILIMFLAIAHVNKNPENTDVVSLIFLGSYSVGFLLMGASILLFRKIEVYYKQDEKYKKVIYDRTVAPTGTGKSTGKTRYCGFCGSIIVGSRPCPCGGGRKRESGVTFERKPGTAKPDVTSKDMGGLRSTMRTTKTTGSSKPTDTSRAVSSDKPRNGYFDSAGNLD